MSWEFIDRPYMPGYIPQHSLITSPADVMARLIERESFGKRPSESTDSDDRLIFVGVKPDHEERYGEIFVVTETVGQKQGRYMQGGIIYKYGVNVQYRTDDYANSWPIRNLAAAFEDNSGNFYGTFPYTIDDLQLGHILVQNVELLGHPVHLGLEKESRRHLFSMNCLLALDTFGGE